VKESSLDRGGFGPTWTFQDEVTASFKLTPILVVPRHPEVLGSNTGVAAHARAQAGISLCYTIYDLSRFQLGNVPKV